MWYLLNAYWIPLLLAGLIGVIVGWMSCDRHSTRAGSHGGWFSGWMPWAVAGSALAALAVVNAALPGKQGLLLDTALMLFGTYMVGCCVGCILKPKPAAHLAHATAGASGKAATAAASGTAGLAAAKTASATAASSGTAKSSVSTGTSTGSALSTATKSSGLASTIGSGAKSTDTVNGSASKSSPTATSTASGAAAKVATAVGAAATGVAATAAAAAAGKGAASAGTIDASNVKVFSGAAKVGQRPVLYNAPRGGKGDELSLIWGVAEKLEHRMNAAGIWHFDQIANWTVANVEWFEHEFEGFKGRLDRDKWIEQCKKLAAGWRPDGHVGHSPKG